MENEKFIELINLYWNIIPQDKKPRYTDFNCIIPIVENIENLRVLEKDHSEFGIANYNKETEGLSTLTFIATITDLLIGKRLGIIIENDVILEWVFYTEE